MGFTQFPSNLRITALDTSETLGLGGFKPSRHLELKWARIPIYKHGTAGGSEQLRVSVYSDIGLDQLLFSSDWMSLSDAGTLGTYWIGRLRFDFDRQFLNSNTRYWLALQAQNYTRNADTFYLGFQHDWPIATYDLASGEASRSFADCALFGYQEFGT